MGHKGKGAYSVDFAKWAKSIIDDVVSDGTQALIVDTNKDNRSHFGVSHGTERRSSSFPSGVGIYDHFGMTHKKI